MLRAGERQKAKWNIPEDFKLSNSLPSNLKLPWTGTFTSARSALVDQFKATRRILRRHVITKITLPVPL